MKLIISLLALVMISQVHAAQASDAAGAATFSANAIKRYVFSAPSASAIKAEFDKRRVRITSEEYAPRTGYPTRIVGTGASGYASPYLIEHQQGTFHVYAERRRPQHPITPLPYLSQEVVFDTPHPKVSPVGTLSYPKGKGPFPGVVLVAGTGPHDRDAGMSLHKTLAVLADHLTRQGYAVLRYDKRGVGLTGGRRHPESTTDDYADDALAAVRFLGMQPNVLKHQIGIVGHSEGAIIAAMVAAKAPDEIGFIVMLGGTGVRGIDLKTMQEAAGRRADGMEESLVLLNASQERELYEIAASPRSHAEALVAMRAATDNLPAATKLALEIGPEGIPDEAYGQYFLTPWLRRFLALDPRNYLNKVTAPVLALGGEKDLQVPPAENLAQIQAALSQAAPASQVRQLPGLNHLFQSARTGKNSEYFLIEETIAPQALALVSSWIRQALVSNSAKASSSGASGSAAH